MEAPQMVTIDEGEMGYNHHMARVALDADRVLLRRAN